MDRTDSNNDTPMAHGSSRVVRYELIDKAGVPVASAEKVEHLALAAEIYLPGQTQDEDRTGAGWDIQIAGAK